MAYTKKVAKRDKITIDGTDVSSSFRTFGYNSTKATVPAGGFNADGTTETLPGDATQVFTGEAYYTEELAAIVEPLHRADTVCTITWQPEGLVDATREIYTGEMTINEFGPANTFGEVMTMPFNAITADPTGITVSNWT
jgi:hypothetical protein